MIRFCSMISSRFWTSSVDEILSMYGLKGNQVKFGTLGKDFVMDHFVGHEIPDILIVDLKNK